MSLKRLLLKDWRVPLLILVLLLSVVAIAPTGGEEGLTALTFGLELEGGTTLQLSAQGSTVESSGAEFANPDEVQSAVSNLTEVPVRVYPRTDPQTGGVTGGDIEFRGNVPASEAASIVEEAGYTVEESRNQVRSETLTDLRESIQLRLENALGTGAGAEVSVRQNILTGDNFIVVEVPGEREEEGRIAEIIRTQGEFEIRAVTDPETDNQTHILFGDEVDRGSVSQPLEDQNNPQSETFRVQFQLMDSGAQKFAETMREVGATDRATRAQHPPVMYFNDREVFRGELNPRLAADIREGTWGGGGLSVTGLNRSEAQLVSVALRSGALPTQVEIVSSQTISAEQGEQFKTFSAIIGLLAIFAVGGWLFFRYRDPRVAIPTVVIGVSEVVALLGFSAVFNFNVDLAYIAGLIAVIGTGVDDLVIIADEVQERGRVESAEVYRKRLKRAFIIIGMAATTTIGAMLPLAYLGLGRISGFAIVTIVGVLIGVLITRPAYSSVLRELITRKD